MPPIRPPGHSDAGQPQNSPMTTKYLLDTSFDRDFAARPNLPWWPWVGKDYSKAGRRTILLGESIYDWGAGFTTRYEQTSALRETHNLHALNYRRNSPYVRNMERAIYGMSAPSEEQKSALWASVVYHNLVLEPLATIKKRPTFSQYVKGWHEFFELSRLLAADQGLVYGLESKKLDALLEALKVRGASCEQRRLAKVGKSEPRLLSISDKGSILKLLFIRHPSSYFSWRQWGLIIREHVPTQVTTALGKAATGTRGSTGAA